MEGVWLEPGEPSAWEQGDVAWVADRPSFVLGDARVPVRLTAVMAREGGDWKIRTAHFSVGVPDEVMIEKAAVWQAATRAH